MIDTKRETANRVSALIGLNVSAVSHAADMLTLQFGPQKESTTRRGTILEGGAWALHIQCSWRLERAGETVATESDLSVPDDAAQHRATERIEDLLIKHGRTTVESVQVDDSGGLCLSLSKTFRIVITPSGMEGDEDWRFFAPDSDARHFVIEGGKVDPWSLS
ncbi:hypothetical protein LJ656_26970 [Paraburkholderia sp. MMS20-SJTR3]|uniref:Uncharacterized protein n=1 Tax=Paraburkholderia sejongensis TaxID=2886946 RepID=A0ABS8K249_9BURK|nr:hypothetical protein [Paraburkholderia sp. MMS20-SJTR3]MCC8396236.1 hypothetical protein [Paraburkholderia sp. MMS20-SJTR3]